jgi:hypothetical protein
MDKQSEKNSAKSASVSPKNKKQRSDKGKPKERNRKTFEEYARFISMPSNEQQELYGYITDQAFAAAHKITNWTLTQWKKTDELWKLRDEGLAGMKRYTPQIMEAMRNKALREGDTAAAKLHLQFIEKWNPKVEVGASIELIGGEEDFG